MLGVTATNYHAPYCSALDFPRMHRFWDITELVLSVILLLSKGDQATLARVNHRLWEIAITEIWSSVPDFRYFMFLLPPKLRERSKDIEVGQTLLKFKSMCFDLIVPLVINPSTFSHMRRIRSGSAHPSFPNYQDTSLQD